MCTCIGNCITCEENPYNKIFNEINNRDDLDAMKTELYKESGMIRDKEHKRLDNLRSACSNIDERIKFTDLRIKATAEKIARDDEIREAYWKRYNGLFDQQYNNSISISNTNNHYDTNFSDYYNTIMNNNDYNKINFNKLLDNYNNKIKKYNKSLYDYNELASKYTDVINNNELQNFYDSKITNIYNKNPNKSLWNNFYNKDSDIETDDTSIDGDTSFEAYSPNYSQENTLKNNKYTNNLNNKYNFSINKQTHVNFEPKKSNDLTCNSSNQISFHPTTNLKTNRNKDLLYSPTNQISFSPPTDINLELKKNNSLTYSNVDQSNQFRQKRKKFRIIITI